MILNLNSRSLCNVLDPTLSFVPFLILMIMACLHFNMNGNEIFWCDGLQYGGYAFDS